jgi:hypothetical protein
MKSGKAGGWTKYMKAEGSLFILICAIGLSVILFPLLSDAATTIHVSPMSLNLGSVKAGGLTSGTITIKNTGKAGLSITSITSTDAEFSQSNDCTSTDIAPGSFCTVTVTFSPPEESFGKKTANLEIDSTDTKKPVINVKLRGKAPPPKISVSPSSVNFGKVNIGSTSSSKILTVRNTGVSDLNISGIAISGTDDFKQVASDCSVVAKGYSCTISITFTPSSPASKESASLTITSDDPKKNVLSVKLSGKGNETSGGTPGGVPPVATDNNVMVITVNGSLCSSSTSASYPNKPCVSVTVCTPGTSDCETIDDILLDTGSSGLRIFKQVLSVPLDPSTAGSVAECIQYADGSADWGSVQIADVILGNEPAVQVPVQVIDSTFGTLPPGCTNADQIPEDAGFQGILGIGLFAQDCGQDCLDSNNGMYYLCDGSGCQGTAVLLSDQVQNPVALLLKDNNGVIVELPPVPLGGVPSVDDGLLVLGIGTEANNVPSAVKTYTTDQYGEFKTIFNGASNDSFIDTGSNGLFFPASSSNSLPDCASDSNWFCPSSTKSFFATNKGFSGSPSGTVVFDIGNFDSLTNSSNNVFAEIGGDDPDYFDWGLPFHFGRNIYVGLEGTLSTLGSGPYWAY